MSKSKQASICQLQQDMEALFDRRFKQQTSHINDLFSNHLQTTKSALDEIKSSQEFLGSKFDDLVASIKEVKAENKFQLAPRCEWKQFFEFRTIIQSIVNGSNALMIPKNL